MTDKERTQSLLEQAAKQVQSGFSQNRRIMSFDQFFEAFCEHPRRHGRSSAQLVRDAFLYYGKRTRSDARGEVTRYALFDAPFDEGRDRMIGQERAQGHVLRLIENFTRAGRVDKLILLHGPNGSAKSTFVQTLLRALEAYSHTDDGALYRFNWVFPNERKAGSPGGIGFGPQGQRGSGLSGLDTYAFLEEDQIDARLVGSLHDHPLLLIPLAQRQAIFADVFAPHRDFVISDYLARGDLSHTNRQIFDALLTAYQGELRSVLKHVQVERFYISRRYRRGAVTVEPQMRVDAGVRQLTADRSLAALPPSLQNVSLFEAIGDLSDANRGVIEYDDLFKRHPDLNKYLLTASERASVSLDDRILFLDLLMMSTGNEMYLDAFKQSPEYASFKGRIELVRLPYLLDYGQERLIYEEQLKKVEMGKPIAPHTAAVAALWAVLTRLKRPQADRYSAQLREVIGALSPLEKADLYARGIVPEGLAPELARELRAALPSLMDDGADGAHYEGRYGASPREMKVILLNASQDERYPCLSPLAVLEELAVLVKDVSVFPFLQMKPDGDYHRHEDFIRVTRERYLDWLDEELQQAMGLVEDAQYNTLFARYLEHVNQSIKKEQVLNPITGKYAAPDEAFMREAERQMGVDVSDLAAFRSGLIASIAAFSIENPGHKVDYRQIFPTLFGGLRRAFFEERQRKMRTIMGHLLRLLDGEATGLQTADRQAAQRTLDALLERGYTQESAREAVAFLRASRYKG